MVVAVGETVFDDVPITEPTPLLIERVVGVPPESVQDNVAEVPCIIVVGLAVKVEITGAVWFTVIIADALVMLPFAAVMLAVPAETGVTVPLELTVATAVLLEAHVSAAVIGFEYWSRVVAVSCCVAPPAVNVADVGESVIVVKTGGGGLTVTVTLFVAVPEMLVAVSV